MNEMMFKGINKKSDFRDLARGDKVRSDKATAWKIINARLQNPYSKPQVPSSKSLFRVGFSAFPIHSETM